MAFFIKKNDKRKSEDRIYLMTDSNSRLLGRGRRMDAPGHKNLYIKVIDGNVRAIVDAGIVQTVPQDKSLPPQMTRVVSFRPDAVALEPMRELGSEVRRNFRVPVTFDSFIYRAHGGRGAMRSLDLSCGGVAFRSDLALAVGSEFEVVIPITAEGPLLLSAQTLRVHFEPEGGNFYACKFINMIDDEEAMLREAVFAIQIRSRVRN